MNKHTSDTLKYYLTTDTH